MRHLTAALILLSPSIASAQCLTADALATGITVEYESGLTSQISRTATGTIMDAYDDDNGYYQQTIFFETFAGVFETRKVFHEKGRWDIQREVSMTYDSGVDDIGSFAPGDFGSTTLSLAYSDYGDTDENFGWRAYESDPLVIGECSYETVRVFTSEFNIRRGDLFVREIKFLPALGFGIQVANSAYAFPANNAVIVGLTAN